MAANSVLRFGAAFPLFTIDMCENLGLQWAGSIPGFLAFACIPFPLILYKYGARIRMKSNFAAEAAHVLDAMMKQRHHHQQRKRQKKKQNFRNQSLSKSSGIFSFTWSSIADVFRVFCQFSAKLSPFATHELRVGLSSHEAYNAIHILFIQSKLMCFTMSHTCGHEPHKLLATTFVPHE